MAAAKTYYFQDDSLRNASQVQALEDTSGSNLTTDTITPVQTPAKKTLTTADSLAWKKTVAITKPDTLVIDSVQMKLDSIRLDSIHQVLMDSINTVKNDSALAMNRNFLEQLKSENLVYKSPKVLYTTEKPINSASQEAGSKEKALLAVNYPGWILFILLVASIIIVIPKVYYKKYVLSISQALINYQQSHKLFTQTNLNLSRVSTYLNLNYLLIFPLFIFEIIRYYNIRIVPGSIVFDYLIMVAATLTIYILQHAGFSFFGYMLGLQKPFNEYFRQILLISKNAGLFLLPMTFIIAYVNNPLKMPIIIFTCIVLILLYLLRLGRGVKIILSSGLFKLYLFLYFCTLEILPVLVLLRYIKGLI